MESGRQIPAIIHQTWREGEIPRDWRPYVESWQTLHPTWEYRLWTDADNRALIRDHYAGFLATYDSYSYRIQRADAARYFILHRYGGVYVDMDVECLSPVDELLHGCSFLAVFEPESQAAWLDRPSVVSNAFLASCPGHPFLEALIAALRSNPRRGLTHRDVLETTGPLMLSNVLETYHGADVCLLQSSAAFPVPAGSSELEVLRCRTAGHESLRKQCIDRGAYAVHYWANTWVGTLAGDLVNPDPRGIAGFEFLRGVDSPGNDIANVGRDIQQAAAACRKLPGAVAFNTDGFVKDRLLDPRYWTPMGGGAFNEGLYVRKLRRLEWLLNLVLRRSARNPGSR